VIGQTLGPYEVLAKLGEGGMGVVYRARDTRLNRDVALKLLPAELRSDPDRVARFAREARTLAALNNPNIGAIHGLEESDGVQVLVLELVEGTTLEARIAQGPIPFDEALPIARQITDAVNAAHEQGIIHRDLKPANIKLRPDGTVKVLDFGLEKALDDARDDLAGEARRPGVTSSPTISPSVTAPGLILGTAAYMSPEQTKGRSIDHRVDMWAFGYVLYEMLTGKRAFPGEDASDTLAGVLRAEPDWSALPEKVPPHVRMLIEGCLTKDPNERIASTSMARFLLAERRLTTAAAVETPVTRKHRWKRASLIVAGWVVAATVSGIVVWRMKSSADGNLQGVTRFSIPLTADQQFTNVGRQLLAISPDGTQIAFVANQRLYLRSMSESEARPIPGTENAQGVTNPTFSPDGKSIAFWSDRTLKRIAVNGGIAMTICQAAALLGLTWEPEGILFGQERGIMQVPAEGGTPKLVVGASSGEQVYGPQALPGGRGILFTTVSGLPGRGRERWDSARIMVKAADGSEPQTVLEGGSDARYLSSGEIVYAVEGRLFAVAFDLRELKVTSQPVLVLEGVARSTPATGAAQFSVSNTGAMAYIPGPTSTSVDLQFTLAVLDATGTVEMLMLPPRGYDTPRVSPNGKHIAVVVSENKESNVWIYDLDGSTAMRRLTFSGKDRFPVWSRDGQYVAFQSERDGDGAIFWQRADFSGTAERLSKPNSGISHIPESWSPTSDVFTYSVWSESARRYTLEYLSLPDKQSHSMPGIGSARPLTSEFSRDGRWLVYNESDTSTGFARATVFVKPFPPTDAGAGYQIGETRNGFHPTWLPDGKRLSYSIGLDARGLPEWVIRNVTMRPFTLGNEVRVPNGGLIDSVPVFPVSERSYDFTPDGKRVGIVPVLDKPERARMTPAVHVVLNWEQEIKRRVPVR
jgi:serine/threonine-protein kinase